MLTTFDNPFNPFEDFTSWFMFDVEKGYYSCNKLARIANITDDMTQKEIDEETNRAIEVIIDNDITNTYKKYFKNDNINTISTEETQRV